MKRALVTCLALLVGCSSDDRAPVVRQYAVNLHQNYVDTGVKLQALRVAVEAFVAGPSAEGLVACQQAWLDARPEFGEAEISRFYNGPLDEAQGRMNEWPIDENFIDYTFGNPNAGIINDLATYPQINEQVLAEATGNGGIENLATGYHAIEFLLWGQRLDQTLGPGERPYTDYVDGGTAANQGRRRIYLSTATSMLLSDMRSVTAQWELDDPGSYGTKFVANSQEGLEDMVRGFSTMAIAELRFERLGNPYVTKDRKDEESCFSESTHLDLIANARGIENVYLGRYHDLSGPSLSDLVKAKNPALDADMRQQLADIRAAIEAIPPPFDHAVLAPVGSDANLKVEAAINSFSRFLDTFHSVAFELGVEPNL
ncbi:MAG TPA: imelysin family protein [Kofleriaceae bacterium]|nr:imelysin family protein [Kofleriaceae bacterium]